jgi:AcrR family transcriptional regulator
VLENPTADRRAARHLATKAEILDAAWDIVRAEGLAALSLRDLAKRVGMQAPSLYQYFDSKHAIYDAMFAQGNRELLDRYQAISWSGDPVTDLRTGARFFIEFCAEDAARYQLLFQRTLPGFEPSPESYAIAVEVLALGRARLAAAGIDDPRALDLWTGITSGLATQQISNDPGGDRWLRLIDDATDMYLSFIKPTKRSRK